eukprot:9344314-Pyramimonas_sp.AAC.1
MPRYLARPAMAKEEKEGAIAERRAVRAESTVAQHTVHSGTTTHFRGCRQRHARRRAAGNTGSSRATWLRQ